MRKRSSIFLLTVLVLVLCGLIFWFSYTIITGQSKKKASPVPDNLVTQNEENEILSTQEENEISKELSAAVASCEFWLCEEEGFVIVYNSDKETIFSNTGIRLEGLSEELQEEIKEGKPIYSESELYGFLESNSS